MVGDGVVVYVDDNVDVDVDIYFGHVGAGVERIRSRSFAGSMTPGLDSPTSRLIRLIHIHLLWESRKEYGKTRLKLYSFDNLKFLQNSDARWRRYQTFAW